MYGGQRTTFRVQFSPSVMWVLSWNQTQDIRLGDECLNWLSSLTSPLLQSWKSLWMAENLSYRLEGKIMTERNLLCSEEKTNKQTNQRRSLLCGNAEVLQVIAWKRTTQKPPVLSKSLRVPLPAAWRLDRTALRLKVPSVDCTCWGPGLGSQYPHSSSQSLYNTPIPRRPATLFWLTELSQHEVHIQKGRQAKHVR